MNNLVHGEEIDIDQRHKRERKELQAKIQFLKKSVSKDKKKKKEVADQILRLERELDVRQSEELLEHENSIEPSADKQKISCSNLQPEDGKTVKISKAQKRREKKANEERERTQRIVQQEAENINGPRNTELNTIKAILKKRNLYLFNIPSDGDCLYKAVSHQMTLLHGETVSVNELRQQTSVHIKENKDDYIPFMSHPDTGDMLTDVEFDDYCDKIANTHAWGGQIEVRALSNLLKCPVHIIQASGPEEIRQGENFEKESAPLVITYHRHMYSLGEHYNSSRTLPSEMVDEEDPPSDE